VDDPGRDAELLEALAPAATRLLAEHLEARKPWYSHELIPWGLGEDYRERPWAPDQVSVSPAARTSLEVNLLTEDNLPYYHLAFQRLVGGDGPFAAWNRRWTAEEAGHAQAIRDYLLVTRNTDPVALEDARVATMTAGWYPRLPNCANLFVYTAAQELATRISHRNAGKLADEPVAYELFSKIASDENHHFIFYRGIVTAMLAEAPSLAVQAIAKQFGEFRMPGTGIPGFMRKAAAMARAGVYNMRIHLDQVLAPLVRQWNLPGLTGLSSAGREAQENVFHILDRVRVQAEKAEARGAISA